MAFNKPLTSDAVNEVFDPRGDGHSSVIAYFRMLNEHIVYGKASNLRNDVRCKHGNKKAYASKHKMLIRTAHEFANQLPIGFLFLCLFSVFHTLFLLIQLFDFSAAKKSCTPCTAPEKSTYVKPYG